MKTIVKAIIQNSRGRILTLFRGDTHPNFPGHRDFPGGEMEPGEDFREALVREIREETGLKVSNLEKFYEILVRPGVTQVLFFAKYTGNKRPVLSWEHKNFEWISKQDLFREKFPIGVDDYYENAIEILKKFDRIP